MKNSNPKLQLSWQEVDRQLGGCARATVEYLIRNSADGAPWKIVRVNSIGISIYSKAWAHLKTFLRATGWLMPLDREISQ